MEGKAIRTHKMFFRRNMKDEKMPARLKLLSQLCLAYIEDLMPKNLLESVIEAEFGQRRIRVKGDLEFEDVIDNNASDDLKQQWELLKGGNNDSDTGTTGHEGTN